MLTVEIYKLAGFLIFIVFAILFLFVIHYCETGCGPIGWVVDKVKSLKRKPVDDIVKEARYRSDDHRGI